MQLRDATDSVLMFDTVPARIVSLVPSLTETIFAFGAGGRIAGVTRYCEEPARELAQTPRVGGTSPARMRSRVVFPAPLSPRVP